ncbi:MAG: hypothetical protein DRO88_05680 [Promethearchaeia archaeon]|nr:MAG: hypothetical protein DRO88_05680 [Candidatus Lokiarchaeia archaeon]
MVNTIPLIPLFITLIGGILFVLIEHFHKAFKIHDSLLAGFSISYFFLVVLPEISENLPEYPLHLTNFEYLLILLGFVTEHLSEKLILQTVERKSQNNMRTLLQMEKNLKIVKANIENSISEEIIHRNHDDDFLKELALTDFQLKQKEMNIIQEIVALKHRITKHINKNLDELRWTTSFLHQFLIGFLLFFLIDFNLISGVLFLLFASFMALITKRSKKEKIFSDLDIEIEWHEISKEGKILFSSATLIGSFLAVFLYLIIEIDLETIFLIYSYASGIILYKIIREEIPEKEKGKPYLLFIGVVLFALFVLIFNLVEHKLL